MRLLRILRLQGRMCNQKPVETEKRAEDRIKQLFGYHKRISDKNELINADKILLQKHNQRIEDSQKIRNYHNFEYSRGQDFIENIPAFDNYTLQDNINEQRDKERRAIEMLEPIRNHEERSKLLRQSAAAYHQKQKRYEIEQFERYLSNYPGTIKGPRPEDDWEAYRNYGLKKIPKILVDEINQKMRIKQQLEGNNQDQQQDSKFLIESPGSIFNLFSKDRELFKLKQPQQQGEQKDEDQQMPFEEYVDQFDKTSLFQYFKTDVPLIPNSNFEGYQHFMNHWTNWLHFRNSYTQHNLKYLFEKLEQRFEKLTQSLLENQQDQYMDVQSNIPSLCRYYRCLPKQIQDHVGMKDIYLGLEYKSPDFTNQEKEQALNYICLKLLPFDQISKKIMRQHTAVRKVYPTPFLVEKVYTMSPEYTWDMGEFLDQIRKQELRGESSSQNKELRYHEPPQTHMIWDEGAPSLPVDYYDNEDGFWDSIISQKLRRYDAHKPMLKTRKYFKH